IPQKQRWLILIGIPGAALGMLSSGYGFWLSLTALLLIILTLMFRQPDHARTNITTPDQAMPPGINKLDEMIKLLDQKDKGIITNAEYEERRADLIYNH
ncbi:MAG TPA: SHOCT domain-containing protein, partial [Niastella sp.]